MNQVITLVMPMLCASFFTLYQADLVNEDKQVFKLMTDEFENDLEKSFYLVFNLKVLPNQQHLE
jgi:hypothetical protein